MVLTPTNLLARLLASSALVPCPLRLGSCMFGKWNIYDLCVPCLAHLTLFHYAIQMIVLQVLLQNKPHPALAGWLAGRFEF